jgi:Ca2+-binding RTX toxin-like protein
MHYAEANAEGGAGDDRIAVVLQQFGIETISDAPGLLSNISGGDGADRISSTVRSGDSGQAVNVLSGGEGNDSITGTATFGSDFDDAPTSNEAHGGAGNDEIDLYARSEFGAENTGYGDDGDDLLIAEVQVGFLDAANGSNELHGGDGADRLNASITVTGTPFEDVRVVNTLYGDDGADRLTASIDSDDIGGGDFHSDLYGGTGNDRLSVTGGNGNFLTGNQGADTLLGSDGADRLIGGQGDDYLRGRGGEDVFEFQSVRTDESDRIADFILGEDVIDVSRIDANVFRGGNQRFSFDGDSDGGTGRLWVEDSPDSQGSLVYADTGRAILTVALLDGRGVDASDYSASDFLL